MGARILVIEDNAANLELMTYLLQAFGHETLAALDGESGLEAIRRERPDLVICDVQLPKMGGHELAARIKSQPVLNEIPLIAVTAFAMVGDREKALAAGFDGYIPKPIAPETFVTQVESFLAPNRMRSVRPVRPEATPAEPAPRSSQASRATILAVDNSPENLSVLRSTLEPMGFTLRTASNVADGLAMARRSPPDLILSDLHMPKENGYDFMKAVQGDKALQAIPFVFISSTSWHQEHLERMAFASATRFIMRPIEPQALIAEIEACLRARKDR